jgi:hypothetical protein
MDIRADPNDPTFDLNALTGTELLHCAACGSTFRLDYADAVSNKDADPPKKDCCAKMMDVYIEKTLRHIAAGMVVSHRANIRKAGVKLRSSLPDSRE